MSEPRAMTEKEKKLFAIFRSAIQAERDAQAMYQGAIDLCEDPMLRAVFQGFKEDEARHEKGVLARYHQFKMDYIIDND
jgi:rubrerythrin